jgi:photosystem II stability/assembly factor-like uncharacterized protein
MIAVYGFLLASQLAAQVDTTLYSGMRYRMVGPFRGGRSTAVTGVADQPHLFYMGTTGGGVWRTEDAGEHWSPLTDGQIGVGSIGAIDVADSDPNVIYAGTGSACIRGNVSTGRGVWKSTDRGKTWRFVGLPEAGAIGDIVVHPTNPDLVYVAALGHPFGKNPERGVFRSRDGGTTWEKVLFLSDSTGAVSLAMNPANPREIYAGMWRAERKPWTLISGAREGGIYKTTDGGDHWERLSGGLPDGLVGKVGLAMSGGNPERVYAIIEADRRPGLYRSDDGGKSWTLVNSETRLRGRPWYYNHVTADPRDPNTVYVMNVGLYRSVDGGRTFEQIDVPHGDTHDLWINPKDPGIMLLGDDGGGAVTLNGARTWSSVTNQPTAEFYDVQVDNQDPYRLYGSQQDNTTISVRHRLSGHSLKPVQEWQHASGCETGSIGLHPDHPEILWGGCYGGVINRMDLTKDTRENRNLYPENQGVAPKDLKYRFQWVAPIVVSPHDPNTVYHGSQYLHRTRDGGKTWETISPDLTTNNPAWQQFPGGPINSDNTGVEVFTTVFAVVVSPHDGKTLWVGTDDGRVHLTRDEGASWTEITPAGMPARGTVNRIEVSPHAPGRAFVAVQRYREDDWRPYLFRTDDFGKTWRLLTDGKNGIPADHPVRVVREDPARRGLLYAGTEFGAFVSFDDGARWLSLQLNLPATPVTDLKVHRGDLVVATQGRSFWILDDLTPLRELATRPSGGTARLFTPRNAARGVMGDVLGELDLLRPDPLPFGALINYALTRDAREVRLEVIDPQGRTIRVMSSDSARAAAAGTGRLSAKSGFNRVSWGLTYPGPRPAGALSPGGNGPKAPPGSYQVRLTVDGTTETASFRVTGNPADSAVTQADYDEQFRLATAVRDTLDALNRTVETIRSVREQASSLIQRARAGNREVGRLPQLRDSLTTRLAAIEAELVRPAQPVLANPARLENQYNSLLGYLTGTGGYGPGSAESRPTAGAYQRQKDLDARWAAARLRMAQLLSTELAAFSAEALRLGLGTIVLPAP